MSIDEPGRNIPARSSISPLPPVNVGTFFSIAGPLCSDTSSAQQPRHTSCATFVQHRPCDADLLRLEFPPRSINAAISTFLHLT